jgi:hypothetical protein
MGSAVDLGSLGELQRWATNNGECVAQKGRNWLESQRGKTAMIQHC